MDIEGRVIVGGVCIQQMLSLKQPGLEALRRWMAPETMRGGEFSDMSDVVSLQPNSLTS